MKRFLSILLVAVMLLGMLPATASAADTEIVFALGANGSASHNDGSEKTSYSETVDGYTLNITGGTKMYTGARDQKGNSCIKLGTSGNTGGFVFTVPNDVTSVVISIAKYKTNTTKVAINGTTHTLSKSSNDGAYDAITVDTSSNKTVTLTTVSGGVRAMVNTITYVVGGGSTEPDEPECTHEGTTELQNTKTGDCVTNGYTGDLICTECGETVEEGEVVTAPGHDYDDGVCSVCGTAKPNGGDATISFANTDQRKSYSTSAQVWKDKDQIITFTNNKASSTTNVGDYYNPCRLYKSSEIVVSCESGYVITSITFAAGGNAEYKTPWKATLENAGVTPVVDGDNYTVNFASGVESFTCVASAQIRIASLSVTYAAVGGEEPVECEHTNTEPIAAVPATCTTPGKTEGVKCSDCGEILTAQKDTPVGLHTFADGLCSVCGLYEQPAELMTALPGNGDKIIIYNPTNTVALGVNDTNSNNKRDAVTITSEGTKLPYTTSVAVLTVEFDGEYYAFKLNDGYLTSGETGNALTFETEKSDLALWTVAPVDSLWTITNKAATYNETDYNQAIEYYYGEFTTYGGSGDAFNMALYLVEKGAEPVVEANGKEFSSVEDALKESNELKLLAPVDSITYAGDLYLDLNGFSVESVVLSGELHAYDSKATTSAASGAKIAATNVANVVKDLTVDGKRYIALEEGEDGYSFHVLEMKLSKVTLRAAAAGIYYKATISCDAELAAATQKHGVLVSTYNMPGADFATEKEANGDINAWTVIQGAPESGKEITSGSVFGIFKVDKPNVTRGETKIYANAYLDLGEGRIILADQTTNDKHDDDGFDGTAMSLRDVVEMVNDDFAALTDEAKRQSVIDMYTAWSAVMNGWDIPNIIAAANQNG